MDRAAFRSFAESFNQPLLMVSAGGDLVWASSAAAALAGEGGVEGRRLHDLVADDGAKVDTYLSRFSRSRQALPGWLKWRRGDGSFVEMHCEGAVVEPRDGDRPALLGLWLQARGEALGRFRTLNERIGELTREVMERKRAEATLRETQARLHIASRAAHVGTWDRDVRTGHSRWSEELERIFGLAPGTFPGQSEAFYERVHPEDRERVRETISQAVERGGEYELEFRFIRADGEVRWMLGRGRAYLDEQGRPQSVAGVGIDITERKSQERALRQSEEWLRFTQRSAQAGSWEWDLRSGKVTWSEEFYRLCGVEPGTLKPSPESWRQIIHPEDLERVADETQRAIHGGADLNVEFRVFHPGKGERWLASLGRPIYEESGQPLRMAGLAIDVTERKRAEIAARFLADAGAELSSSLDFEATLRKVAQMAVPRLADWCAVDIMDPGGAARRLAVTHVDPAKVDLAREVQQRWPAPADAPYGVQAVLRTGAPEIVPEITEEMLAQGAHDEVHLARLLELGLRSYLCVPLVAHGRVLGALTFVAAESGRRYTEGDLHVAIELASRAATAIENARLYAAAQQEIVERRRAEEELARQGAVMETIAENAASCLFMMDTYNRSIYMNAAAQEVTGYSIEELRGQTIHDVLHHHHQDGSDYPSEACPVMRALQEGRALRNVEEMFIRKDGTFFPVSLSLSPIVEADRTAGAVLEFRDITEQKRAQEALRRHAGELARSNAELEDFAYITSHDLKEPLRGISNYAGFLLEDYGEKIDDAGQEKLQTLVRLSKRMYSLLDALMEHARLGRVPLRLAESSLDEIVSDVLTKLGPRLEDEQVEVTVRPLPRLKCDRRLVRQLLTNLVENAIEFNTQTPKRVEIGGLMGGPGCTPVVYVRDNGIGIARQHLSTIFRMFKRLHHRDQYGGGIGFGLTIARRIVERHGGRIWAESSRGEGGAAREGGEGGEGATFYFTLGPGRPEPPGLREQMTIQDPSRARPEGDDHGGGGGGQGDLEQDTGEQDDGSAQVDQCSGCIHQRRDQGRG